MSAKSKSARPTYCKGCVLFHGGGIKDGNYNCWCCHHAQPAHKVWKHCQLVGGKQTNE